MCAIAGIADSLVTERMEVIAWGNLRPLVAACGMPWKDEAVAIINEAAAAEAASPGGNRTALLTARLKQLRGGEPWQYMLRNLFPALRGATCVIEISKEAAAPDTIAGSMEPETVTTDEAACADSNANDATVIAVVPDMAPSATPQKEVAPAAMSQQPRKPFYMSLSTNMLYDALLVPNIGAEIYAGRRISVAADWMYGWWDSDRRHRYWRIYGGDLSVRYWPGSAAARKPLTGHHVGIYGQALIYDFEFGGKGQMAGKPGASLWESCNWGFGVDYGFSLPVGRRLNIDFTLGIGYLGGKYYDYVPLDGHYVWQSTHRRHWFGPTRAKVSLVWLIGRGNRNEKGGGR